MTIPTFAELYTSINSDLRNKLGIVNIFGKKVLNAFSSVMASKFKLFYANSAFVYKNILPDTADSELIGGSLSRHGRLKLGRDKFPATAGEYKVSVTGSVGAIIPQGTTFKSLDTLSTSPDKLFILDDPFTFVGTTGIIQIRALDLGAVARLEVADKLQVTSPLANVNSFQEVTTVEVAPTEAESDEDYRLKIIEAYRLESQGGSKGDYKIWSADAAGVRRVYPYVKSGDTGTVQVFVEANPADSVDGNGTPSAAIISNVEDVIELDPDVSLPIEERGRRPMTAIVEVLAITTLTVDIDIVNLGDNSFLPAISDAIKALLFNIRPFVDGADNPNESTSDLLYDADIYNTVRDVIGSNTSFDSLTMSVDGSAPLSKYEFLGSDIPFLNSLTDS